MSDVPENQVQPMSDVPENQVQPMSDVLKNQVQPMTDMPENQVQMIFDYLNSMHGNFYRLTYHPRRGHYIFQTYQRTSDLKTICFDSICVYEHSYTNCRIVGLYKSFAVSMTFPISDLRNEEERIHIGKCFTDILINTCFVK